MLDREEIQRRIKEANKNEIEKLVNLDKKVDSLYANIKNQDKYAIPYLKAIVSITHDGNMVA